MTTPATPDVTKLKGKAKRLTAPQTGSPGDLVARANKWRDAYNPFRGFTISHAVSLREAWFRGEMAEVQWAYLHAEMSDPDLIALRSLRSSSITAMDWNIKIVAKGKRGAGFDEKLAADQKLALRAAYEKIDNFNAAIEHLTTAAFRGFAHLEKWRGDDRAIVHLELVDQWNVLRNGFNGGFRYNPQAAITNYFGVSPDLEMEADAFLLLDMGGAHINFYALPKFCRASLGEKDWTAFLEIYGIPGGVVVMGPNQNPDATKLREEATNAARIAEGGTGALPYGASYTPNDSPRGVDPFTPYLKYFSEKLVLVGTGGKLTMLTESGSGTLAGGAHTDTFKTIATGEARRINEVMQRGIDREILDAQFPGKPRLAYFELAYADEADPAAVVDMAAKLATAGYRISAEELSEKTGLELEDAPGAGATQAGGDKGMTGQGNEDGGTGIPVANGDSGQDGENQIENRGLKSTQRPLASPCNLVNALGSHKDAHGGVRRRINDFQPGTPADPLFRQVAAEFGKVQAAALQPLRNRLAGISSITDPAEQTEALAALRADLPNLLREMNQSAPASAAILERALAGEWLNGLGASPQTPDPKS